MNKSLEWFTESMGWIGVFVLLVAYGLLTFDIIIADSILYHALNLIGGAGIMIDAFADKNYQPVVLNIAWISIAIWGVVRLIIHT
jgi:hypothetical protein